MLVGHLETGGYPDEAGIPPARIIHDRWISAIGIWNMKGALASYVAAVLAVRNAGLELAGDVTIAGVAGTHDETLVESRLQGKREQGYSVGTRHLLSHGGVADFGIVGEPTSFHLVEQHFGMTGIRIDIQRQPASNQSQSVDDLISIDPAVDAPPSDAISKIGELIQALRIWIPHYQERNRISGKPPLVTIPGIEGGNPWMRTPAQASSIFVFAGTPPGSDASRVLQEVRSVIDQIQDADFKVWAELFLVDPGPSVPDDCAVAVAVSRAHEDVFGHPPPIAVVDWHTDAGPLAQYGIPAVNYGPSGRFIFSANGRPLNELVRIADLVSCAKVYVSAIVRVCAQPLM
jgi:acetylornithine deacetylase